MVGLAIKSPLTFQSVSRELLGAAKKNTFVIEMTATAVEGSRSHFYLVAVELALSLLGKNNEY